MRGKNRVPAEVSSDGWLACPICGSENLHQDTVTIFDRSEDAENVQVTTSGFDVLSRATIKNGASANPSYRRHGMLISFWCESCDSAEDKPEAKNLAIYQHKGLTIIEWVE